MSLITLHTDGGARGNPSPARKPSVFRRNFDYKITAFQHGEPAGSPTPSWPHIAVVYASINGSI